MPSVIEVVITKPACAQSPHPGIIPGLRLQNMQNAESNAFLNYYDYYYYSKFAIRSSELGEMELTHSLYIINTTIAIIIIIITTIIIRVCMLSA